MKISLVAAIVVVSLSAASTASAQKFREPTKEELQMTSDPKAPGAPAVFLYREEITDNFSHFVSEYARIKVLTEKGKEWATVEVPFSNGAASPIIEGRTIHSDGTLIPLENKGTDLLVTQRFRNHLHARVFNLPSVEVGSILEYRWTVPLTGVSVGGVSEDMQAYIDSALASSIPFWDVQQDIFIHREHFYYNPLGDLERNVIGNQSIVHITAKGETASYLLFSARLPQGARVQLSPRKDYTLELTDVPPAVREDKAPPEAGTRYRVRFYYTPYLSADVFWNDEGKRWSKEIDRFCEPSSDLKAAAIQITSGVTSDENKARKLYDAVQALNNTGFSREVSKAERNQLGMRGDVRNALQVWNEKSGNREEIALLYLALARAAGLSANAMAVADRSRHIFDPGYLSLDQFTDILVVLNLGGKDVFLDPGQKVMPFGQLLWSHALCGGLMQTAKGTSYTDATPPNDMKDAIAAHAADLTLDDRGAVTGTVKVLMNGPEALRWRQLNLTADSAEVRRQIAHSFQQLLPNGINSEIREIQGLDTPAGYLSFTVIISGSLGSTSGKRLIVPAFLFSSRSHEQFVSEEKRELPIDMSYADQVLDDVVYHLPAGYALEAAPKPAQLPWAGHATLAVKTQAGPGTIDIKHIFARAFVLLDAKEYPSLRDYYQKIAASDQQEIVLIPAAARN
jgi:hypothetical protein